MSNHPLIADRDCRSLREKYQELEGDQTVRVVSESRDVLARVKEDALERKMDGHHIVEVLIKVYGDSRVEHEVAHSRGGSRGR